MAVTGDGRGVEGRAGARLLVEVAERTGLAAALRRAFGHVRPGAEHVTGKVLLDLVVMLADGGRCFSDIDALARRDAVLFGAVASQPTAWRTVKAVADDELGTTRLAGAVDAARRRAWRLGAAPDVAGGTVVVDLDATIVPVHSEKERATGTFKRSFGFHPLLGFLDRGDGTGETLAGILRPGNATAHKVEDNIEVLDAALAALPPLAEGTRIVVRSDAAGATKELLRYIGTAGCGFSVSFPLNTHPQVRAAIRALDEAAWQPASSPDGGVRADAAVAELTALVDLAGGWPQGMRLIARREPLHPGAQQTFDDLDGQRFTVMATDDTDPDIAAVEGRHRLRARAEQRVEELKDLGLAHLPSAAFTVNEVWLWLAVAAQNLLAWTRALCLDGDLRVAQPATLRHRLLHVAARIARSSRRTVLRLQADWPWTPDLLAAFRRIRTLPDPAG